MKRISIYTVKQVKEKSGVYDIDNKRIRNPSDANHIVQLVLDLNSEACEKFGIITLTSKNDFHNHPSGDPTPSTEDIDLTKRFDRSR